MDDFFRHENHDFPPSLSEYGKIRKPTMKSDFLNCLIGIEEIEDMYIHSAPIVDAMIVDGPALVQMNTPKVSSAFGEYCNREIGQKVKSIAQT